MWNANVSGERDEGGEMDVFSLFDGGGGERDALSTIEPKSFVPVKAFHPDSLLRIFSAYMYQIRTFALKRRKKPRTSVSCNATSPTLDSLILPASPSAI
jgi:hypothetical protein